MKAAPGPSPHEPPSGLRPGGFTYRFWGVRGSIATPGPATVRYGGNTPCLEVRAGEALLVFDGGTGLRALGDALMERGRPTNAHIFLSHMHWDHIQGIPFFRPAFAAGNRFTLYGERKGNRGLRDILEGQMRDPNFPVPLSIMESEMHFREIGPGETVAINPELSVDTLALNHPNDCLAFRVRYRGRTLIYATDTEQRPDGPDAALVAFSQGADLLIHDAMYTEREYGAGKQGWGHSTYKASVAVARAAQVKRLSFFHHAPEHDDAFLDARLAFARSMLADDALEIDMAREGETGVL
jgi:phosphoribosyl 1,2-cyclic phosphodiesterase